MEMEYNADAKGANTAHAEGGAKKRRRGSISGAEGTGDPVTVRGKSGRKSAHENGDGGSHAGGEDGDDIDDDALLDSTTTRMIRPLMPALAPGGLAAAIQGDFQILVGGCTTFVAGGGCIITRALDISAPLFYGEHKKRERRKDSLRRELRRVAEGLAKLHAMVATRAASGRGADGGMGMGVVHPGVGGGRGRGHGPVAKWSDGLISMMRAPPEASGQPVLQQQGRRKPGPKPKLAANAEAAAPTESWPPRGLFKMSEANIARQAAAVLVVQQGAFRGRRGGGAGGAKGHCVAWLLMVYCFFCPRCR